jgi:hypothetical protein
VRAYVGIIILALAIIALAVSLMNKPREAPLQVDSASPGVWPEYAQNQQAMPQMLVTPCPLTTQNLPIVNRETRT